MDDPAAPGPVLLNKKARPIARKKDSSLRVNEPLCQLPVLSAAVSAHPLNRVKLSDRQRTRRRDQITSARQWLPNLTPFVPSTYFFDECPLVVKYSSHSVTSPVFAEDMNERYGLNPFHGVTQDSVLQQQAEIIEK